ncbi:cupin domain-containing protein [Oscillochloris sp. ZM17-4]|nr:cupin domain-containing protein [Oscillochloris sp. ZM17-4]MBX0326617.1 cupin domain-containing protein [Oscillochloris sp. ZM17-4]
MSGTLDTTARYRSYPAYRDSGVEWLGEVPAHWAVKRLRFVLGRKPTPSEASHLPADTPVSFLPMELIGDDGTFDYESAKPIGEIGTGYTYFAEGDVTVAKITPCFENGKGALMVGLVNGVGFGTTELHVLRPGPRLERTFLEHWAPRSVAQLNDYDIMVVKVLGAFVWHAHPDTDDFFLVLKGRLTIRLRDREVTLGPGELFVVPRGVEHQPVAAEECHLLLIEPTGTPPARPPLARGLLCRLLRLHPAAGGPARSAQPRRRWPLPHGGLRLPHR